VVEVVGLIEVDVVVGNSDPNKDDRIELSKTFKLDKLLVVVVGTADDTSAHSNNATRNDLVRNVRALILGKLN
jgi:hypothetical protein